MLLTKSVQCRYQVESNECSTEELFSDSKKVALKPADKFKSSDACRLCGICLRIFNP